MYCDAVMSEQRMDDWDNRIQGESELDRNVTKHILKIQSASSIKFSEPFSCSSALAAQNDYEKCQNLFQILGSKRVFWFKAMQYGLF